MLIYVFIRRETESSWRHQSSSLLTSTSVGCTAMCCPVLDITLRGGVKTSSSWLVSYIMVAYDHHGSRSPLEKRSEHQHHNHYHRLTTMTTTSCDNDHVDQDDIMREDDLTPHLSHPGTENSENPNEFHRFRRSLRGPLLHNSP